MNYTLVTNINVEYVKMRQSYLPARLDNKKSCFLKYFVDYMRLKVAVLNGGKRVVFIFKLVCVANGYVILSVDLPLDAQKY